jgi:signal transduction histidine kinase
VNLRARWRLLLRPLRRWLGVSVHRRLSAVLLATTLAFSFLISTTTYFAARFQLQHSAEASLAADAARLADRLSIPLVTLIQANASLAMNPVIRAGLASPEGARAAEAYLQSLPTGPALPAANALFDGRGRMVALGGVNAAELAVSQPWILEVLKVAHAEGDLVMEDGDVELRLTQPVRGPGGEEGVLVSVVDLDPLLAGTDALVSAAAHRILDEHGRTVAGDAPRRIEQALSARAEVILPAPLTRPGLVAEVTLPREVALRPLTWLSALFTIGTLVTVVLALVVARVLSRRLVRPLVELAGAAGRIAEAGHHGDGLPDRGADELARLARAFNDTLRRLEAANQARLEQLRERNVELQRIHDEQKRLEVELHQAQKLEAVGQLAAGIAHEINTPIQYIGDNTRFLEDAVGCLKARAARLEQVAAAHAPPEVQAALAREAEEQDLDYVQAQALPTIRRTLDGTQRVATIVRAMKEFAHPDQREMVATDLNRALKATLEVSRNEYRYVAEVETDLTPLPLVTCHPGEVNQVFLNLIVNAAHAIGGEVKGTDRRGLIEIRSRQDGEWVEIEVADDGPGIPEAIQARVFEPFFTTKEVGRGTGQGLAIARSVVEKHGGALRFQTAPGLGTTFSVRLPVAGPPGATP